MKRKMMVIRAIIIVFLLPITLTFVYSTSSFLEESVAKVFVYFDKPSWTKADQVKVEEMTKQTIELRKHCVNLKKKGELSEKKKPRLKVKELHLKNWAEKNGKIKTLEYVGRRFGGRIKKAANRYKIEREMINAIIVAEWNPKKNKSKKGAIGPMGLMPATAKMLKVDPYHEFENILGGTRYLARLIKRYGGNLTLALAAYNAGPGNVDRYNGVPPFKETKNYVGRVKYIYNYQL